MPNDERPSAEIKNATLEVLSAQAIYEAKLKEFEAWTFRPTSSYATLTRQAVHDALDAVLDAKHKQTQLFIKSM